MNRKAYNKKWYKAWRKLHPYDPVKAKEANLKYRYKLSLKDYIKLFKSQNKRCAICKELQISGKSLSVDHDHKCCPRKVTCGKCIRGLLCYRCNLVLGWFERLPFVQYLKKYK